MFRMQSFGVDPVVGEIDQVLAAWPVESLRGQPGDRHERFTPGVHVQVASQFLRYRVRLAQRGMEFQPSVIVGRQFEVPPVVGPVCRCGAE